MKSQNKLIISLFDYSGNWCRPYKENGYEVIQVDLKHGRDEMKWDYTTFTNVHGILAAPPCTDFATSGNTWWGVKDRDGRTAKSILLIAKTLEIIKYCNPAWWVIENPAGRLPSFFPKLGKPIYFNPCDFGDPYTKRTGLWGDFIFPYPLFLGRDMSVKPEALPKNRHSIDHFMMGKTEYKTRQEKRSVTPPGFSSAFYEVNQ